MLDKYGSHADYMSWVKEDADLRKRAIENALNEAFSKFIEKREVKVIVFSSMTAFDLARAITNQPAILKPLLAVCNIAARAIERDLSIKNLDTYAPKISDEQSNVVAGYIKPFLPSVIEIGAMSQIDRISFIDKEIRKRKGQWEKKIIERLSRFSILEFQKRMFNYEGEKFELDAASPKSGDIKLGVDIKRIEARRDIHKRCDEIVNKASKLKLASSDAKFATVIYYPFIEEHVNIQNRLHSGDIDCVVFASETKESIENAIRMLLSSLGLSKK